MAGELCSQESIIASKLVIGGRVMQSRERHRVKTSDWRESYAVKRAP
ncbi:hypothetical protein [Gracilibacillus xinjiangensis]|uniref:Uncharacterized protein n=1 Tax=Gracilibacillus xinjiangensis TaxID=1193282 RepID=A0ABV8WS84_9BACI